MSLEDFTKSSQEENHFNICHGRGSLTGNYKGNTSVISSFIPLSYINLAETKK